MAGQLAWACTLRPRDLCAGQLSQPGQMTVTVERVGGQVKLLDSGPGQTGGVKPGQAIGGQVDSQLVPS